MFAGKFGIWEIVLILVIILIIFGVGKLPQVGDAVPGRVVQALFGHGASSRPPGPDPQAQPIAQPVGPDPGQGAFSNDNLTHTFHTGADRAHRCNQCCFNPKSILTLLRCSNGSYIGNR